MSASTRVRRRLEAVAAVVSGEGSGPGSDNTPLAGDLPRHDLPEHLHLLLRGARAPALATVKEGVVGYGTRLEIRDLETGERSTHDVMDSYAMDLTAGHVSIDSPMGQALLGKAAGATLRVDTPGGSRKFRISEVRTLLDLLDILEAGLEAPTGGRKT